MKVRSRLHARHLLGGAVMAAAMLVLASGALAAGAGADTTTTTDSTSIPATTTTTIPVPICPSSSANGQFVRFIYLEILNRCPDGGAASFWTGRLDAGMSRWAFAEAVDMSNENVVVNNVDGIYEEVLNRAPTAGEEAAGVREIRTNHQDARLIALLASSDEFYATLAGDTPAAKDQTFLALAYNAILDRDPDSAGLAYFTAQLGEGGSTEATRHAVALHLELSTENMQDWIGSVYGAALNRGPDDAGFAYWLGWLQGPGKHQTFRMWTHMLASPEGYGIAQTQPNPPAESAARHTQKW